MTSLGECLACESLGLRQSGSAYGAGLFVTAEALTYRVVVFLWVFVAMRVRSRSSSKMTERKARARACGGVGCGDDWHPANPDLQMLETPPQRAKNARWGPRIGGICLRGFLMLLGGVKEGNSVVSAAPALRPFGCAQGRVVAALVWVFLLRVKL